MPVQTAIQVRRGTAASWTSTNPTLAAGEIGFETDTNRFKIGTGSAAWASLNYFAQDPVTTKGDLYTFSTTDTRLAVGNNGETLVADSSTSTGLRWGNNYGFTAGKNKIINGDFGIWQRGTSFTITSNTAPYTTDRFTVYEVHSSGTCTVSRQTFTAGSAPVSGYEGQFFLRVALASGASTFNIAQPIEDVRTFAGQTVTFSFWAKATSSVTVQTYLQQIFGSGGSATVNTTDAGITIGTSWARYTTTIACPSISGKTIGTNSSLAILINYLSGTVAGNTIDTWGWQLEAGSVATPFQTATGTLAGELAACQRYYYKHPTGANNPLTNCAAYSTTNALGIIPFRVTMRTAPTMSVVTGTNYYQIVANGGVDNINSFTQDSANTDSATIYNNTEVAQTAGHAGIFISNNASASIAWSAEL